MTEKYDERAEPEALDPITINYISLAYTFPNYNLRSIVTYQSIIISNVSSNKYELALTSPATIGAVNVAMYVFRPFTLII